MDKKLVLCCLGSGWGRRQTGWVEILVCHCNGTVIKVRFIKLGEKMFTTVGHLGS